jgi:thiol-disulfide isomerase/thioredoxin
MKLLLSFFLFLGLNQTLLAQKKPFSIGDTLPNFEYQGQFARNYQLKELKGSYVLVQFWASWNQESRSMQFDFIDTYGKYKDKKFKKGRRFYIVSVSLDEDKVIWELSLKKDNLPWKSNVCDFQVWNSPIVKNCRINSIPFNYLLDPDGRIIAKNITKDQLDEILKGL